MPLLAPLNLLIWALVRLQSRIGHPARQVAPPDPTQLCMSMRPHAGHLRAAQFLLSSGILGIAGVIARLASVSSNLGVLAQSGVGEPRGLDHGSCHSWALRCEGPIGKIGQLVNFLC